MKAGTITNSYVHAVAASPAVTLTARKGAGVALVGWAGNMAVTTTGGHVTGVSITAGRLTRTTHETWTLANQLATTTALLARLDAGLAMDLAGINTDLLAQVGSELTNAGGSVSRGLVTEVLACMAGRTYRIAQKRLFNGTVNQFMDATYPSFKMNLSSPFGGFTESAYINGDTMSHGEIKPSAIGGSLIQREVGGIRHTYNVDSLTASLVVGQLSKMTTSSLLWPTSNIFPQFPFGQAGFVEFNPTTAPRLVTVYDDAGAVL